MYSPCRYFHEAGRRKITVFRWSIESFTIYYSVYPLNYIHMYTLTPKRCIGISSQILVFWRQVLSCFADAHLIHDIGPGQFIKEQHGGSNNPPGREYFRRVLEKYEHYTLHSIMRLRNNAIVFTVARDRCMFVWD